MHGAEVEWVVGMTERSPQESMPIRGIEVKEPRSGWEAKPHTRHHNYCLSPKTKEVFSNDGLLS